MKSEAAKSFCFFMALMLNYFINALSLFFVRTYFVMAQESSFAGEVPAHHNEK